jgi:inhibitor of cysteine peptidase
MNRTYLPLRFIAENLSAKVDWDASTKTVTVTNDNQVIQMTVDQEGYIENNTKKKLDAAPMIYEGRTLIPIRALEGLLNKKLYWNDGLIVISDRSNSVDFASDPDLLKQLKNILE